jgi:choice-of-anchor A domain-containing protein
MCDVILKKTCPGNSVNCYGPPAIPPLAFQAISWTDFNVISFDSFTCDAGDVEGRLAVRNKAALGDFTLGLQLKIASDGWKTTSLIVGGAASWRSGSLHPDGSDSTFLAAGPAAFAYIGGVFTAPTYLQERLVDPSEINRNIDPLPVFDQGRAYYTTIQSYLANLGYNAVAELKYGDGIFISCNSATADVYHVKIDSSILNVGKWFTLSGCRFASSWIIDVTGTGPVVIQGQAFPGIVERVIYNVVGSGRTISGDTGVAGHILAPQNTFTQSQGVTYGIVVAGNVTASRQNNKPNCLTFRPVVISTRILKAIRVGDTNVYVADLSAFIAGDLVCINSDCRKIVAGSSSDVDGDGVVDHVVTVDQGFTSDHSGALFLTTSVSNPDQDRNTPLVTGENTPAGEFSSASSLVAAFFAFAALLL